MSWLRKTEDKKKKVDAAILADVAIAKQVLERMGLSAVATLPEDLSQERLSMAAKQIYGAAEAHFPELTDDQKATVSVLLCTTWAESLLIKVESELEDFS